MSSLGKENRFAVHEKTSPGMENPVFQTDGRLPLPRICPVEFSHQPSAPAPAPPTSPFIYALGGEIDLPSRFSFQMPGQFNCQGQATILLGVFQGKPTLNLSLSLSRSPFLAAPRCPFFLPAGMPWPQAEHRRLANRWSCFPRPGSDTGEPFLAKVENLENAEGR